MPPQLPITTPIHSYIHMYSKCLEKEEGKEWNHVTIVQLKAERQVAPAQVECKYCKHVFVGGASRIREHLLHINPACGVAKCTADEAVLQPVLDEMRAIDAQNKATAGAAAAQRQLDKITAANASRTGVTFLLEYTAGTA